MRSEIYGFFRDEILVASNRFQIIRWFIIYFVIDMAAPFVYDPFFLYGPGSFFSTILDMEDFVLLIFVALVPMYIYWNYENESGIAAIQALALYIFTFDWLLNLIYELLFEDSIFFIIGCLILVDYFALTDEEEVD